MSQPSTDDRTLESLARTGQMWGSEAAVLSKYGDDKAAAILRDHATTIARYVDLLRRQWRVVDPDA